MRRPFQQTAETTTLITLFPEDFPDSRIAADLEEAAYARHCEEEAAWEYRMERYIAANFDECGHRFGELTDPHEDAMERMLEAYDPGLNCF